MLNVDRKDFKCSITAVRIYMNKNIHEHFLAILSISFMRYELFSRPMALIYAHCGASGGTAIFLGVSAAP